MRFSLVVSNMRSPSGWHSLQQDFHRCRVCLVYSLKKPVPETESVEEVRREQKRQSAAGTHDSMT